MRTRVIPPLLSALALCAAWPLARPTPAAAQESSPPPAGVVALQTTLVDITRRIEPSVVAIARYRQAAGGVRPRRLFPRRPGPIDPGHPDFVPNEYGTGVVVSPRGKPKIRLILTCYHVVRGGLTVSATNVGGGGGIPRGREGQAALPPERIHVRFSNRRGCAARIFAADPRSDLAVLALDAVEMKQAGLDATTLPALPLVAPPALRKGQFVLLLGNPYAIARDGSASVGWGLLSNLGRFPASVGRRDDDNRSIHQLGTLLQLDTRLRHGTSGGPVLDLNGRLLGLTTAIAPPDGLETASGFAIPINAPMLRIIDSLMEGYEVEYGFLGIQPDDVPPKQLAGYSGRFPRSSAARAARVFRDSPAARGGLRAGDLILAIDKQPIANRYDLMRMVELAGAGQLVTLSVWRESTGQLLSLPTTLGKWPVDDDRSIIVARRRNPPWRGLVVDYATARRRFIPASFSFPRAVLIRELLPDSPAATAGLEAGDFIEQVGETAVETPADFFRAVDSARGPVSLKLLDGRRVIVSR